MSQSLPRYKLLAGSGIKSANSKTEADNMKSYLTALGDNVRMFTLVNKEFEGTVGVYIEAEEEAL